MTLKDRIGTELKEAMRARDQVRVDTLRSALSAFSYRKIESGRELEESEQIEVVRKLVKQRTDSIDDLRPIVREAVAALPEAQRNQGAAMKVLMPQLKGEADGNTIRQLVLEELGRL